MFNNNTTPVSFDALAVGRSSTNPFITVFQTRNPNTNDVNFPIQQRWYNTMAETEYILVGYSLVEEVKTAIWQPINASQVAAAETLTGNSGGPVAVDVNNNINVIGDTTTINIVGNPGTNTLTASTGGSVAILYTEDSGTATPAAGNLIVTGGSTGLTTLGSGHTVSITGTLNVAHGGTGDTSFTAYAPITGGTTTTSPLQSASTGQSTSGFVFTSTGGSSLPTFQAIYTKGTFVPTLSFGGSSTGITYASNGGNYTTIGNLLFFSLSMTLTSKGAQTGVAVINGLPISAVGGNDALMNITEFSLPATTFQTLGQIDNATTQAILIYTTLAGGANVQFLDSNFTNTTSLFITGFYPIS